MGGVQIKYKDAKGTKAANEVITNGADFFAEFIGDWETWGPKLEALSAAQKD